MAQDKKSSRDRRGGKAGGPNPGPAAAGTPGSQKRHERPRALAARTLARVLSDHETLDEALASVDLSAADRAWLKDVCSGTLRWKGRLDLALDSLAEKKKPSGWLRRALLIAAYQLIVQENVPAAAVVSETVEEIRRKEGKAPASFANAMLRRLSERAASWRTWPSDVGPGTSARVQAAWASVPEWLWRRLVKSHGFDWARAYSEAVLERPVIWVRARDPGWSQDWAKPGPIEGSFVVTTGGRITDKEGFGEGEFLVQDISNQVLVQEVTAEVTRELARNGADKASLSALDICAAPGGKSVGMAWSGFDVTATDRDDLRMALLRDTVARAAGGAVTVLPFAELANAGEHDLVWVDAPCTSTGIIRRHPDIRWLRRETDVESLAAAQLGILKSAWKHVKPGGFLVYSVCSVLNEEGPGVIDASELSKREVKRWFLAPQDPPHGDGFFAVLLRKPA